MLVEDGMFDDVDGNDLVVNSTTKIGQQERVSLDIEVLWKQAIDLGRVLLLDENVLDPDIVHEKSIMFKKVLLQGHILSLIFHPKRLVNKGK